MITVYYRYQDEDLHCSVLSADDAVELAEELRWAGYVVRLETE